MKILGTVLVFCSLIIGAINAARILALMPFPGKSHYINIQPIMQRLAERGHDVTVVTTHTEKNPPKNYHQIVVDNRPLWEACKYKNAYQFIFRTLRIATEAFTLTLN